MFLKNLKSVCAIIASVELWTPGEVPVTCEQTKAHVNGKYLGTFASEHWKKYDWRKPDKGIDTVLLFTCCKFDFACDTN